MFLAFLMIIASISTFGEITVQDHEQTSLELTETESMHTGNTDTDMDGVLDTNDACPNTYGTSTEDRIGCIDTDGDGWSDLGDDFHNKVTQWKDTDGDGLGDNWGDESFCKPSHWPGEFVENAILTDDSPLDFDNDGFEDEGLATFPQYIIEPSVPLSLLDIAVNSSAAICSSTQTNGINSDRYFLDQVWYDDSGSLHIISTNSINIGPMHWELQTNHSIWDGVSWTVNTLQDENGSYSLGFTDLAYVNNTIHAIVDVYLNSSILTGTAKYGIYTESGNWHFQNISSSFGPLDLGDYELVASEVGFSDDVYLVTGNAGDPVYYQVYSNVTYANNGISESIELNAHWMASVDSINGWQGQLHSTIKSMDGWPGILFSEQTLNYMDFYIDSFGDLTVVQDLSLLIEYNHRIGIVLDWNCGYYSGAGMEAESVEPIAHLDPFDKMHLFSIDIVQRGQLFFGVSNSSYSSLSGDARCIDMEPFDSPDEFGFTSGQNLKDYYLGGDEDLEGVNLRMEVDSNGFTHVVYTNCFYDEWAPMKHRIKYAIYDGVEWDISIIVPFDVDCAENLDFVLSNDDQAYIGYTNLNGERMSILKESDESISNDVVFDSCPIFYGTSTEDVAGCIDNDNDGWSNAEDLFPGDSNEWEDSDGDGVGDNSDEFPDDSTESEDSDGDGVGDNSDQFPYDSNESIDSDGDGFGDNSDAFPDDSDESEDSDDDGVGDNSDEFPYDPTQFEDNDEDGYGDNINGNNPDLFPNNSSEWADTDGDGHGDEEHDEFPLDSTESVDTDNDGTGDNADIDDDGDGVSDTNDTFPLDSTESVDTDNDGFGDNSDTDDDNDLILDIDDLFPLDSTESIDTDNDGTGNNADIDDDGDGVSDTNDAFPLDSTESVDTDNDGTGDNADIDDDGDDVFDTNDTFPLDSTESVDTDNDGTGDNADVDDDGDGVFDTNDTFPLDSTESVDTDHDGIGNNADTDDDGDGVSDSSDDFPEDPTEWADVNGDGLGDNKDPLSSFESAQQAPALSLLGIAVVLGIMFMLYRAQPPLRNEDKSLAEIAEEE